MTTAEEIDSKGNRMTSFGNSLYNSFPGILGFLSNNLKAMSILDHENKFPFWHFEPADKRRRANGGA